MMDGLSAAANVIAVIQIAETVALLCSQYLKAAKNAKRDIKHLQDEVNRLVAVLQGAQNLLQEPKGMRLETSQKFRDGLNDCSLQLTDLKTKLERRLSGTRSKMRLIEMRARWPFESKDVDDIVKNLGRHQDTLSRALNIDQTILLLDHFVRIDVEERLTILEWISPIPHGKLHEAVKRTPDTCEWLLRHEKFREWETSTSSVILWLQGSPGAGKTYLTSKVIDHVQSMLEAPPNQEGFAFFYCNRNETKRREPLSVLQSYVRQLSTTADNPGKIRKELRDLYWSMREKGSHLSFDTCKEQLLESVNLYPRTTLVLDALDECDQDSRSQFVTTIEFLLSNAKRRLKVFISSRPDRDIRSRFLDRSNIEIQARHNEGDIRKYVDEQIKKHGNWRNMPLLLKQDIVNVLLERSEEMFQWVSLQIKQILDLESENAIRDRLGRLPIGLSATYDEIYGKIRTRNKYDKAIADRAFMWVICAYRPLSSDELLAAVHLDPEDGACLAGTVTEPQLLHLCNNLLVLDSQRKVWKLSHLSVAEYFEQHHWGLRDAHYHAAKTCLKLLIDTYAEPNSGSDTVVAENNNDAEQHTLFDPKHPFQVYSRHHWICHVQTQEGQDVDSTLVLLLKTFLGSPNKSSVQYRKWHHQINLDNWRRPSTSTFNNFRLAEVSPENAAILAMCRFSLYTIVSDWWDQAEITVSQTNGNGDSLLALAAAAGSKSICETLIFRGIQIDLLGGYYGSALAAAVYGGETEIVKFLVKQGADVNILLPSGDGSALAAAAYRGRTEIVKFLVDQGADVNMLLQSGDGSALAAAAYGGETEIVEFLVDQGADVNMPLPSGRHGSALAAAATGYNGDPELVKFLVDQGADVNMPLQGGEYGSALAAAAYRGRTEIVKFLVDQGADVNMLLQSGECGSALAAAAGEYETEIVKFLVDQGADVNMPLPSGDCGSALAAAACEGRTEIVKFLVNQGADVNMPLPSGYYGSALAAAACEGWTEIVKFLVDQGADVSITNGSGATPLIRASMGGHLGTVRLLLQSSKTASSIKDNNSRTALFWAAWQGYSTVVQFLLDSKQFMPNARDWYGSTPLFAAVRNGHIEVVEKLCGTVCHSEDLTDGFGRSLIWWARRTGDTQIVQTIIDLFQRMKFHDNTTVESSPIKFRRYLERCNACTRCVPNGSIYYNCSICDYGDSNICSECFERGVKCRDISHILVAQEQ